MEEQNVNHPIDESAERREFERVIGSPPYEHMCDRHSPESAWPGQYKRYETELAWQAWQTASADLAAALRASEAQVEALRGTLEYLIERADDSDGAHYGTLSTRFVRGTALAALAGKGAM